MKKQIAVMAGLMLASSMAFAAQQPAGEIGLGIAHANNGGNATTIYVPYTLGNGMWVEPFVAYSHVEDSSGVETESFTVGAGLFKDVFSTAKTKAYVGSRIGYVYSNTPGVAGSEGGLLVQPTLGFAYQPVSNVGLGAEAFVQYSDSDITGDESWGTGTQFFVRYFFAD